ncbi:MaoC family dehydratase [Bradyrhizobium hipponense]|uniref:MaoC family dehydratase n=1 Tax=Bradyrhizobium hipponense TaxID=2605638 RepID=A0A5S4YRQ7_9BRAD|nr:MaoC family dehydratase [Bradyrhizobium hipponense]TYO66137.1 MaoC family dehydratase [Bradyrhizobium hipponense]
MTTVTLAAIRDFIGQDLGRSHWVTVDQSMIEQFAACTGDRQWIHVDTDRASKESASGGTIAHGFLSLSLIASLGMGLGLAPVDASAVINYGLDKVRFLTPVKSGSRVRLQLSMTSVDPKDNGSMLIKGNAVLEIENSQTPALVAETLTLVVP